MRFESVYSGSKAKLYIVTAENGRIRKQAGGYIWKYKESV
jgi:hypothetical protein